MTCRIRIAFVVVFTWYIKYVLSAYLFCHVVPTCAWSEMTFMIELINKDLVPYCGSNDNNSTGVSLCEILFSFMSKKYIVCDPCGLRSPSFESSSVLYITPTCTSSMQQLIKQGMEQKLEKSGSRCKKNTWHVETNYILQPPKYLIIVVNRFRYINNNFTKDRCSIPMDKTIYVFWPLYCLYQLLQKNILLQRQ